MPNNFIPFTLIILLSMSITACSDPPSKYEKWVNSQTARCIAAGGHVYRNIYEIECWRHPLARHSKIIFKSKFLNRSENGT